MPDSVRLVFESGFGERDADEAKARGWDAVRLSQDLAEEADHGTAFIAEPGMIVVTEVTQEKMLAAVNELYLGGYFARLRPLK